MKRAGLWIAFTSVLWLGVGAFGATLLRPRDPTWTGPGDVTRETERRAAALELSADQQSRLAEILRDYRRQVVEEDRRFWSRVQAAAGAADESIEELLTAEQRLKYRALILGRSS